VPVARSDPRRATIIGIVGVVVGTLMILLVLFAGNLGSDSSHTTSSRATFDVGSAKDRAAAIDRDQTPLFFPDTATGSNPIVVQHTGTDPTKGWSVFDATSAKSCVLTWHRESKDFTDCNGTRYPADGGTLHHYPTRLDGDDLIVDLNPDASSANSTQ
jgi:hypothetical protein